MQYNCYTFFQKKKKKRSSRITTNRFHISLSSQSASPLSILITVYDLREGWKQGLLARLLEQFHLGASTRRYNWQPTKNFCWKRRVQRAEPPSWPIRTFVYYLNIETVAEPLPDTQFSILYTFDRWSTLHNRTLQQAVFSMNYSSLCRFYVTIPTVFFFFLFSFQRKKNTCASLIDRK